MDDFGIVTSAANDSVVNPESFWKAVLLATFICFVVWMIEQMFKKGPPRE